MPDEQKQYPKVCTGVVVINKAGKVFLLRGPRFENKYHIPGGHVEWGEKMEDCAIRETKEETGLDVHSPEFIRPVEFVFDPTYDATRHIIPLDFVTFTEDSEDAVKLDNREGTEYAWMTEAEIRKSKDIEKTTKETILMYFDKKKGGVKNEDYKESYQRALADYANLQKETAARRGELVAMSELQILEEFIPVYDNFKKAYVHHPELKSSDENNKQIKNWIDGVGFIKQYFAGVLKSHGVEEIKTVGQKFDPKFHESIGEEAVEGKEHGIIIKEIDGGYMMKDRVVKVAKVVISK